MQWCFTLFLDLVVFFQNIPLSADFLLDQMKKLPDGSFIVGGKEVSISGIDMLSGKV